MTYYILTREDCKWCDKAKALLDEKGLGYQALSYTEHPILSKLIKLTSIKTVPQIWLDNKHIGGYSELYNSFFESESNAKEN